MNSLYDVISLMSLFSAVSSSSKITETGFESPPTPKEFLHNCTQSLINPTPVIQTAYITLTPEVSIAFVTVTPSPEVKVVTTTKEVVRTTTVTEAQDGLLNNLLGQAAPKTQFVTLTQTHTAIITATPAVITVTVPEIHTLIQTATVTATPDLLTKTMELTQTVTQILTHTATITATPSFITMTVPVTQIITQIQTRTANIAATPIQQSITCPTPDIGQPFNITLLAEEEILQEMSSVVQQLTVDPHNVSRTRRKKESALDERPSAQTMGLTATMLLLVGAVIVMLLDIPVLYRDIRCLHQASRNKPPHRIHDGTQPEDSRAKK